MSYMTYINLLEVLMNDCWNCKNEGCFICEDHHDHWGDIEHAAIMDEIKDELNPELDEETEILWANW